MRGWLLMLALAPACGGATLEEGVRDASVPDAADGAVDASIDAGFGPWSTPAPIPPAATTGAEDDGTMTSDTLELTFGLVVGGVKELYVTRRASVGAAWGAAAKITELDAGSGEETPRLSPDNLTIYFGSKRSGVEDIYTAKRTAVGATWTNITAVAEVNTATAAEKWFAPCAGGTYLVTRDAGSGNFDIYEGTLGSGAPTVATELNSTQTDTSMFLTPDCLTVYYTSPRDGKDDLLLAHRGAIGEPWSTPTQIEDFEPATPDNEQDPWISPDGKTFVFASDRDAGSSAANTDLFISTRN